MIMEEKEVRRMKISLSDEYVCTLALLLFDFRKS
jgi:hypothetical protein